MKIKNFKGRSLHGYLDFNVKFNSDLTFLTGINGSGKTSVIQSIVALISPSFFVLCNLDYKSIAVEIENEHSVREIYAVQSKDVTTLGISGEKEELVIPKISLSSPDAPYLPSDKEDEYYRDLMLSHANHVVMSVINSLPTPMFLDLDRRAKLLGERRTVSRYARSLAVRRQRNIFAFSLARSLETATSLAEGEYRDALLAIGRAGDELRRQMILDLLQLEPGDAFGRGLAVPERADLNTLKRMRHDLHVLPQILQIPAADIESRLVPTLDALEAFAAEIPQNTDIPAILSRPNPANKIVRALIGWSANRPQLKRLVKMVDRVREFNEQREKHIEQSDRYLKIVNSFLKDSGKDLFFDEHGSLWFRIEGQRGWRPTSSLSSGEGQLFVIITHLLFNPQAKQANVFIIDEPELSLHIQWQELFVDSVVAANSNIQYILATHAPGIIMDRIEKCIDLSKPRESGGRG